ncbi:MAG: hypothetical protein ACTSVV_15120 [Promethearchaeota archaeon]
MERENNSNEEFFFEEVVKKTKTGVTFPKSLRDSLFEEGKEYYFKLKVPKEKNKIILEILNDDQIKELKGKIKVSKTRAPKQKALKESKKKKEVKKGPSINWSEIFLYEFDKIEQVKPILESAFISFKENPEDISDAMGRVKYALVSYISSTSTENAKLYYSIERFLIQMIKSYNLVDLIDWIFKNLVPQIKSKFLYELALLDLVGICMEMKNYEKAEEFIFYVLKNIDDYPKSEMYNIMNSFKQLVKKILTVERENGVHRTEKIDVLLKEKLLEYGNDIEEVEYKIQIVEFLEDLNYIELAYKLAKEIQMNLPQDSMKLEEVRKLVRRLHQTPITEHKDTF